MLGTVAGAMFLLVAVLANWSVPVALIGAGVAMLAGSLGGLALSSLGQKDEENSE